jgi:hypothetical protein
LVVTVKSKALNDVFREAVGLIFGCGFFDVQAHMIALEHQGKGLGKRTPEKCVLMTIM